MHITSQIVFKNLIWKFAERCGAQAISLIVSVILARILSPRDYGVIALVMVFLTLLEVFVNSGLGTALIQKTDVDELDYSSVFFANVVLAVLLYVAVWLLAPFVAAFYQMPEMVSLLRALGLTLLIFSLRNVQQVYVSKHMMFRKFFFATLAASILSAIVGIGMAFSGFGVWALVGQQLTNAAAGTATLWLIVPWRPSGAFSWDRWRVLYDFGWKIFAAEIMDAAYRQLWQLLIGKLYSPSDLAFYTQGQKFPQVIITNINASIDSVLLPTMASAQENAARVRDMTRRSIKTSIFVMAPLMMGMAFSSVSIVRLVLTEKWLPCVPFFCIACVTFMFWPVHTANLNALKALGRSDLFLKLEILKIAVGIIIVSLTARHSVLAMAYGTVVSSFASQLINSWPNRKLLGYGYLSQLWDFLPSVLLAVLTSALSWPVSLIGWPDWITLIIQIPLGMLLYVVVSMLIRLEAATYLWGMLRPFLANRFPVIKKI